MNDFENIVLRRLAQAGGKALTRKQLSASLLFDKANLNKSLQSLNRRGLVHVKVSRLLGLRFALSETGRRYALEQGYLVQIQVHKGPLG
jgi:predicted transcriptional regulator